LIGKPQKKGPAIKEKITFLKTFFFLPFKNKNYFTLNNLSNYGNITLKITVDILLFFYFFFLQIRGYFSPKIEEKKCQNPFPAILRLKIKKFHRPHPRGGRKALMAQLLRNELFLMLPNKRWY